MLDLTPNFAQFSRAETKYSLGFAQFRFYKLSKRPIVILIQFQLRVQFLYPIRAQIPPTHSVGLQKLLTTPQTLSGDLGHHTMSNSSVKYLSQAGKN